MAYLKLSLVLVMLVFCGSGLSGPIEGAKEELKLTDPGVPEALQAAYAELGKNSDARYRRLKALSVTRADLTGGSGKEYDFKMLEDRDCSKIDGTSPDALRPRPQRPNEADKEERLDMNDPDVQEAIEAAVNELSKHSDARFRRLRAWAVKKVDPADLEPNESSSGYEIKMRELRDCSKIKQTSPGACIQCNVFVYKKTTDKPPKYTITKMNCVL
ncbi:hypothetical protein M8J77_018020 [Diaphorina citri]|nr:hypothetical protein M8J77_018020 [Diaphorina citri]